jgi:hypothetical protein
LECALKVCPDANVLKETALGLIKPRAEVTEWRITLRTVPYLHDTGMTVSTVDISLR